MAARWIGSLLITYSLFPLTLWAAHPLVSDDTGTQGQGKFQLELTAERGHDDDAGTKTNSQTFATTLSYGFHDSADLIASLPHQKIRVDDGMDVTSQSGRGDASLAIKWRFYEKSPISVALKPGLSFSTGDEQKGLGAGKNGYSLDLITSMEMGPWTFHLHLGLARHRNTRDERENLRHLSAGGWYSFREKWRLTFDVGTDTNTDKSSNTNPSFAVVGVIYGLSKDLDLDAGIKKGISSTATDQALLTGLAWRF